MRWVWLLMCACRSGAAPETVVDPVPSGDNPAAHVEAVTVSGSDNDWTFSVTLASDETGCPQYADWWEVVGEDGSLLYRRILAHSHPDEQPFTRSGGPVPIAGDTRVWVRGHLNTTGYSGRIMAGTPNGGFTETESQDWDDLAQQAPLPDGCAF